MESRLVSVRALAKINLALRVLEKRADGYHELRTIFQTISLADRLDISYRRSARNAIEIDDPLGIPNNLVVKAAELALEATGARGHVAISLHKGIPMGAGLAGGSSDAAAVLLALPVLAGRMLTLPQLLELGTLLGSDVPFFLLGGTAAGIGRGTELFPLPDFVGASGLLVVPDVTVSTAEAYRRLSPRLTTKSQENKIFSFQSLIWDRGVSESVCNDFEEVVFEQFSRFRRWKRRLVKAGAYTALMTGSGSAIFGLFSRTDAVRRALKSLQIDASRERICRFTLVSRERYRRMWWRALEEHIEPRTWPPLSRYAR